MNVSSLPRSLMMRATCRAFTLVELLVSMVVLSLLLVMVVQMVNAATVVTGGSTKHLTTDSQARLIFDRMAVDIAQMVKRPDVDYFFLKTDNQGAGQSGPNGDDQMAFYSETSGYYPTLTASSAAAGKSNNALVGYCMRKNTQGTGGSAMADRYQLARLSKAFVWNTTASSDGVPAMTFLPQTLPATWPAVFNNGSAGSTTGDMSTGTDPDFQVLGEQVFRMEICYLVRTRSTDPAKPDVTQLYAQPYDTSSNAYPHASPPTIASQNAISVPAVYNSMRDVMAIVVTLAVLDSTSSVAVRAPALNLAAQILPDNGTSVPSNTALATSTMNLWTTQVLAPANNNYKNQLAHSNNVNGLPDSIAAQVRFYERYFYLSDSR